MFTKSTRLSWVLLALMLSACVGAPPEKFEKADPSVRVRAHTRLAASYIQRKQLDVAKKEVEEALEIDSNDSAANHVMAILQLRLNHSKEARAYFERAVKDPKNSAAKHDYGIYLCRRSEPEKAMQLFQQALDNRIYQKRGLTSAAAGHCLLRNGDKIQAERYLRVALTGNPRMPAALFDMAKISFGSKKYLPARGYIERYFEVGPETPDALLLAVKIEKKLGSNDVAERYASRLRKKFAKTREAQELSRMGMSKK